MMTTALMYSKCFVCDVLKVGFKLFIIYYSMYSDVGLHKATCCCFSTDQPLFVFHIFNKIYTCLFYFCF